MPAFVAYHRIHVYMEVTQTELLTNYSAFAYTQSISACYSRHKPLVSEVEYKLMNYPDPDINIPPDDEEEEEEIPSDGLPHVNEQFADESQEDLLDELGEYS